MPLIAATQTGNGASTSRPAGLFCSPVEARRASHCLGPCNTMRSLACGPIRVRPAAASRARFSRNKAR